MRFCDHCGTFLRETKEGLWCPKCDILIKSRQETEPKIVRRQNLSAIHVVDTSIQDSAKVSRTCPKCGSKEAYHWFSSISGDHAGVKQERTVEHFQCAKCFNLQTESS